jgi:hypothetical protein
MPSFSASVYEYRPKSATAPKCKSRPAWVKQLKANGTALSLDAIWRQAGRHFADSLDPEVVGFAGSARRLATETAWRLVSMMRPTIDATTNVLELVRPGDLDVQRLAMEILGVGGSLELLRSVGAIDARTLRKLAGRFDFEAYSRGGDKRIWIEAKGSFDSPSSRQKARKSIQSKINFGKKKQRKTRSYDQRLGVIMLGWPAGVQRGDDFEIADPYGEAGGDPEDALAAVSAFYARTFQLVGVQGAERFWEFSRTPNMTRDARRALFQTDRRAAVSAFSRVSVAVIFDDVTIEFGGSFWMTSAVPFKRDENEPAEASLDYCYVGVDKSVVATIGGDTPLDVLALTWTARQGSFDIQLDAEDVLMPAQSAVRRFRGTYHLSDEGLLYIWSNIVPSSGTIDLRTPRPPE